MKAEKIFWKKNWLKMRDLTHMASIDIGAVVCVTFRILIYLSRQRIVDHEAMYSINIDEHWP